MDPDENYELNLNPEENFNLADAEEVENFVVGFEEPEDMELGFGDVTNNGTDDFNSLYNRPSYNGETMTGDTNIPEVVDYEAGENITIENHVISAKSVEVDDELSTESINPVQNNIITTALATKVDGADLATVAFSGDYDDLNDEPQDFTEEEWQMLWTNY